MTHVFRRPTAIVRSLNSFASNHPDYKTWAAAGFHTFAVDVQDPYLSKAQIPDLVLMLKYKGEDADTLVAKAAECKGFPVVLELEWSGGLMPFGMQADVFTRIRKAFGPETKAPLAIFAPPLKDEINYGAAVDAGMFVIVECYGRQNDAVVPPVRCVGRIMTWYDEAAARMQGVGARRVICAVSAGQANYFVPKLPGTGTHGLYYWTADDDQSAGDAARYATAGLIGPQPDREYVAWA